MNIGKIKIGSDSKTYSHNLGFDNNTTYSFGFPQPLMSVRLEDGDRINCSYHQLTRLAPMPCPSFARMSLRNDVSFVPMAEIVPYYEALLSRMKFSNGKNTYTPTQMPCTRNTSLVWWLLSRSLSSVWIEDTTTSGLYTAFTGMDSNQSSHQSALRQKILNVSTVVIGTPNVFLNYSKGAVSIDGADYVVCYTISNRNYIATFRLSQEAKQVRTVLIGLGYSLDILDNSNISFAPILAYYKAYFDLYAPQRTLNWLDTYAFKVIKLIEDYHVQWYYNTPTSDPSSVCQNLTYLLNDIANAYATLQPDFVSANQSQPTTLTSQFNMSYKNASGSSDVLSTSSPSSGSGQGQPSTEYVSGGAVQDYITMQMLQRITRYVNKDSIIGKKLSDWIKVHYGGDVVQSLFKDSYHIHKNYINLDINEVFSTSDTQAQGGEYLGSFAGKSVNFNKNKFDFKAPCHGYLIMLGAILPYSGYWQGNQGDLYCVDMNTIPQVEIDALGYELTPASMIYSSNDIAPFNESCAGSIMTNTAFGFIPRLSGTKYRKNIVNGDMSRRGTIDDMSPYYNDRILSHNQIVTSPNTDGSYNVSLIQRTLPAASDAWRYPTRYPYLGNFNRLFYNSGTIVKGASSEDTAFSIDDNFIVQCVFDVRLQSRYRPISESFDTVDDLDNKTIDVEKQ